MAEKRRKKDAEKDDHQRVRTELDEKN